MARGYEFLGCRNGANPANVFLESGLGGAKYISCWCHRKKFNEKASRGRNESPERQGVHPARTCRGPQLVRAWLCRSTHHRESLSVPLTRLVSRSSHTNNRLAILRNCLQDLGFRSAWPLPGADRPGSDGAVRSRGS